MINFNFPTLNLKETGNRIHTLRVNCGYTVEEIAGYMGFTGPQAVYKWEWGKSLPTVDNLYALSKLFGVTIEKILVGNDESFLLVQKPIKPPAMQVCPQIALASRKKPPWYNKCRFANRINNIKEVSSNGQK